jgi:hypothetical protein
MPETPHRTYSGRAAKRSLARSYGTNSYDMIRIQRMPKSQQQAEDEK